MSQCDCTWRQDVKGLTAWKGEFEENLSEELYLFTILTAVRMLQIHQTKTIPSSLSCISPIYSPTLLLYFFLVFFSPSSLYTGFHSVSQKSMVTAHTEGLDTTDAQKQGCQLVSVTVLKASPRVG